MSNIYNYSVINDFGGSFGAGQFVNEINADPTITTTLEYVQVLGDVISVVFVSALSSPELTALNNLVSNFVLEATNTEIFSDGKIIIRSNLADPNAIDIRNGDPNGGLSFTIGLGGIRMESDNVIELIASAESKFTTSAGNLIFDAAGLLNMDSDSGMNIGINNDIPINIGNSTGVNTLMLKSGTGGLHLDSTGIISLDSVGGSSNITHTSNTDGDNLEISLLGATDSCINITSQGTGNDSVRINATGGMDTDTGGPINFATSDSSSTAIVLDSVFGGGGINISSGSMGIGINSNGGLIGIGHFNGGDISIGTATVARTINIGNLTGATTLNYNSGTGGHNINSTGTVNINSTGGTLNIGNNSDNQNINIANGGSRVTNIGNTNNFSAVNIISGSFGATLGNDASGGEIQIATTNPKTVKTGNTLSGTKVFQRYGDGGFFKTQRAHTILSDSNVVLTVSQLLTGILIMDPTANRDITLPDASTIVSNVSGLGVDDSLDFTIMNTTANDEELSLLMGSGGTSFGVTIVDSRTNGSSDYRTSGSGYFRLRMTNVTASSEAYVVYRIS